MQNHEHYTAPYFLNPQHKVTVLLLGVGGTGSKMLTNLAMIDQGLAGLGHPGLFVVASDPDTVTEANIGRQQFSPQDIGLNKAEVLVSRINRFYGLDWAAVPERVESQHESFSANIIISCVDNMNTRKMLAASNRRREGDIRNKAFYWIDTGNGKDFGQVILSTKTEIKSKNTNHVATLMNPFQMYPDLVDAKDSNEPSCSLREALFKQDLFINSMIALQAADLLWKMFTRGKLSYQGVYVNQETLKVTPIPIKPSKEK